MECMHSMLRLRGGVFNTEDIFAQMDRAAAGDFIEDDDDAPANSRGKDQGLQKAAPRRKRAPPSPPQEESDKGSENSEVQAAEKRLFGGDDAKQQGKVQAAIAATPEGEMSMDTMTALLSQMGTDKPPETFKMPQV